MTLSKAGRSKQAKVRKLSDTVVYRVYLIGISWWGFGGTYSYSFDHLPTEDEITTKAGDFQSITDYEVEQRRTIHYTDGELNIIKIVRPWARVQSVDTYCDANGC